jgi:hypothetical protein
MCRQIRLLLLLTSACSIGTIGSMAMAEPTCSSHPIVVPIELHDNLIFVPVQVNGSGPHSFLLDTGASESFLNTPLASSLGFGSKQHKTTIGAGESSTNIGSAKGVTLSLADIDLPLERVAVIPLAGIEAKVDFKIEGVVGAELFSRYVVTIDYGAKQTSLCEPGNFDDGNRGDALTLRLSGNRPFVHA